MTQKQRILLALRQSPSGVCVSDIDSDLSYTLRNRASELRRDGYPVVSRPCRMHKHRSRTVARYSLTGSPEQLEIPA